MLKVPLKIWEFGLYLWRSIPNAARREGDKWQTRRKAGAQSLGPLCGGVRLPNRMARKEPRRRLSPVAAVCIAAMVVLLAPAARADEAAPPKDPRHLAFGANYVGAQLRGHINPRWAAEMRFLTGKSQSTQGSVSAKVFGLRGYRFWDERRRFQPYAGLELAYAESQLNGPSTGNPAAVVNGFGDVSGFVAGGFGGVEFRVARRVKLDFDIGPYWFGLKEKVSGMSSNSWDFVANTAVVVYLF